MDSLILSDLPLVFIAFALFALQMIATWIGYWYWNKQIRQSPDEDPGRSAIFGGFLPGLTILMLSFTFGIAASKFELRRALIIEEANAIGTAILRCDLYPDSVKTQFKTDLIGYVDARIRYYDANDDPTRIREALADAAIFSGKLWRQAATFPQNVENLVRSSQMIPALNSMIDIVGTREANREARVPHLIYWVLLLLALVSAFLAGYELSGKIRNRAFVIALALMTTLAFYLIIELDRPYQGLINLNITEQHIVDLKRLLLKN